VTWIRGSSTWEFAGTCDGSGSKQVLAGTYKYPKVLMGIFDKWQHRNIIY